MHTRRQMREARRLRSRRVRAVLAAGLVLGVGSAATLAAWNDSEFSSATFTAGKFGITGSLDGQTFTDYTISGSPAPLNFQLPPTAMTPGMTTYALFSVKTLPDSVAGNVTLSVSTSTGALLPNLSYGVRLIPTPTDGVEATKCGATAYNASTSVVVPAGTAMATGAAGSQPVGANGSGQVNYCFAVTLSANADNSAQSKTANQVWQVLGTSS